MVERILSRADVVQIKELIWNGARHIDIATKFGVARNYVSWIAGGGVYGDISWPDGSIGKLSEERKLIIRQMRGIPKAGGEISKPSHPLRRRTDVEVPSIAIPTDLNKIIEEVMGPKEVPKPETYLSEYELAILEDIKRQHEEESEEELLRAVTCIEPTSGRPPRSADVPFQYEKYDWEDVQVLAPFNKFVKLATEQNDSLLQEAICIVFCALPKNQWQEEHAWTNILSVREKLEKQ